MFHLKLNKYGYFHSLEFVGRCSQTQLQVSDNLNYLVLRIKGLVII